MTDSPQASELPPQVIAELRSMGDLQAPPKLWQGVRAQLIIDKLDIADVCQPPEVAGPGFINLKLKDSR